MVIDTGTKGLSKSVIPGEDFYILYGGVDLEEDVSIALPAPLMVMSSLKTSGRLHSNVSLLISGAVTGASGIVVNGNVEVCNGSVFSAADIYISGNLQTKSDAPVDTSVPFSETGDIFARNKLRVEGDIDAVGDIHAGEMYAAGYINSLFSVESSTGDIETGTYIQAERTIGAGRDVDDSVPRKIICPEIRYGLIKKGVWVEKEHVETEGE